MGKVVMQPGVWIEATAFRRQVAEKHENTGTHFLRINLNSLRLIQLIRKYSHFSQVEQKKI